ncbi:MAG: GGDEF domain-containing protein [Hyphomonas sp.]
MSAQIFIMLLNPGIGALLAASFYLLWVNQRSQTYIFVAAAGYACNALGFLFQDVLPHMTAGLERVIANAFLLMSAWLLSAAILQRFRVRPPHILFGAVSLAGLGGILWYFYVAPDLTARIMIASTTFGILAAILAACMWPVPKRQLVDKLLFWLAVAAAANFLFRPLAILWLAGGFGQEAGFRYSLYWTTVQFTQAMISIMIAVNLMVAVAIDLVSEIKHEASTDKLSGLLNRRGFESKAAHALARCQSDGLPAAFLIADLDHFKRINDTWGHPVGDSVIRIFGQLTTIVRSPDMVAGRIGGEEFAILLPNADLAAARLFAEALRTGFAAAGADHLPAGIRPTVSIGLCAASPGMELYALMGEADRALYNAKHAGRDRVEVAAPGLHAASAALLLRA